MGSASICRSVVESEVKATMVTEMRGIMGEADMVTLTNERMDAVCREHQRLCKSGSRGCERRDEVGLKEWLERWFQYAKSSANGDDQRQKMLEEGRGEGEEEKRQKRDAARTSTKAGALGDPLHEMGWIYG